jgi:hypothetical protein
MGEELGDHFDEEEEIAQMQSINMDNIMKRDHKAGGVQNN